MQALTFGQVDVRTVCANVDITGLLRESWSFDAYSVFTHRRFVGITKCLVLFGVCLNGAAELAIDVEVDRFPGIVEEPKVDLWRVLR